MTSSGPFQSYFSMIQWKGNPRGEETQKIREDRVKNKSITKRAEEMKLSAVVQRQDIHCKQFPLCYK